VTIDDWAIRDRPLGSSLALTLAAGASWLAVWGTGAPLVGFLVAAILAGVMWRTWIPIRFELGVSGVTQSILGRRTRVPWVAILKYETRSDGVLLLHDATTTPLSPLRGLYVHWHDQRDQVVAQLDYHRQTRLLPLRGSTHPPSKLD
jgi:hypothetical protein